MEAGNWKLEAGGWKLEAGSWKLEARSWKEVADIEMVIKHYSELDVYELSYDLTMRIFVVCKEFPKDEKFSLTSQIVKSSRSVTANIVEGWSKREYENVFKRHLIDSLGSLEETKLWLRFAMDCNYMSNEHHDELCARYDEVGKKLFRLHENWVTFNR